MLLCGKSGAGKSSLAYACARSGWTYTSDDASYILRDADHPRATGNWRQFRFRPSAKTLFPELAGRSLTPRAEGKPSIEVPTSELSSVKTAEECAIHYLVLLNHQVSGVAELVPLDVARSVARLGAEVFLTREMEQLREGTLQHLLATEVYELRYSDIDGAVGMLRRLAGASGGPVA